MFALSRTLQPFIMPNFYIWLTFAGTDWRASERVSFRRRRKPPSRAEKSRLGPLRLQEQFKKRGVWIGQDVTRKISTCALAGFRNTLAIYALRLALQEEDASQHRSKKTLFSGALRRHVEAEQQPAHGKRTTVHRGCHTGETEDVVTATLGL